MKTSKNQIPPIVKMGAWLLSLITFIVGFWHSHLGLKSFNLFNSEYGSLAVAGIVLLMILLSYNLAVNGRKSALVFYIFGGLVFFVFNLNYFYPSYLGRKLISEETDKIKEIFTAQKSNLNSFSNTKETDLLKEFYNLFEIKNNILTEIAIRGGFGSHANQELEKFRQITGSKLTGERRIINSVEGKKDLVEIWDMKLTNAIENHKLNRLTKGDQSKLEIIEANIELDSFYRVYKPILDSIANDDERIILDSLKSETYRATQQIKTLKIVVDEINKIDSRVNAATVSSDTSKQNKTYQTPFSKEDPKSKHIGKFEHTLSSVKERINKNDTWGVIFLCLFIDLLVPLFIYIMIRRKDGDESNDSSFWNHITSKNKPSSF